MLSVMNAARSFILWSDRLSGNYTLYFNGERSHRTILGGCISVLVYTVIAIYSVFIFRKLFIHDTPSVVEEITEVMKVASFSLKKERQLPIFVVRDEVGFKTTEEAAKLFSFSFDIYGPRDNTKSEDRSFTIIPCRKLPDQDLSELSEGIDNFKDFYSKMKLSMFCVNTTGRANDLFELVGTIDRTSGTDHSVLVVSPCVKSEGVECKNPSAEEIGR